MIGKKSRSRSRFCSSFLLHKEQDLMPITRPLASCKTGRVSFAPSPAPCLPLAGLVSNPTPPGQISRERTLLVFVQLGRVAIFGVETVTASRADAGTEQINTE
jgi:hypothetical protein